MPAMLSNAFAPLTACGLFDRDLLRQRQGVVERSVADAGGEPDAHGLLAADHATRECQLLGDVETDEAGQQLRSGHVGDEAPPHLEHRHLHVGRHDADVGAERDLEAATERDAVHRGDHRCGDLLPDERCLLAGIGDLATASGNRRGIARAVAPPSPGTSRSRARRRTPAPPPTARPLGRTDRPSAPPPSRRVRRTARRRARSSCPGGSSARRPRRSRLCTGCDQT